MDAHALRELARRAVEDPSILNDVDEEQVTAMRRAANPAGGIVQGNKVFVNMSINNWSERIRQRQVVLTFIAYFSRLITEYEPDEEKEAIMLQYEERISAASGPARAALIKERDAAIKEISDIHRKIIRRAFNKHFDFDPDRHVSGSKSKPLNDEEREALRQKITAEMVESKRQAAEQALRADSAFSKLKSITLSAHNNIVDATNELTACIRTVASGASTEDKIAILARKTANLRVLRDNLGKVARPLSAADCADAVQLDPPAELFHHFERFSANHHEFINDLTVACYREKPDIEFMVRVYSAHGSAKEAAEYCKQHQRDFTTSSVFTIESGHTTLLGPYAANRERLAYYNQNTELLRLLNEQAEADAKLSEDMLKKTVRKKKKQNIAQDGPDKPGLNSYRGDLTPAVVHDGAKKEINADSMRELEKQAAEQKMSQEKMIAIAREMEAVGAKKAAASSAAAAAAPYNGPEIVDDDASSASAGASASAASAAQPKRPQVTEASRKYGIFNMEEHFYEREPEGEFDKKRHTGNFTVNDTDDSEQPDDAVAIQVFYPKTDENGNEVLGATTIYTQAEAPLHLQANSPYKDTYQPARNAGDVQDSLTTQVVTDSGGAEHEVVVVRPQ